MNHYSLKFLWADFRSSLECECHLFSFRAKYTFPLENVHFLFCLCAQNNLMNIRLKGIGANITSSQTDWYTLPIILRKTSPQISFISLATIKWTSGMKTKGNTDTHGDRLGWWVSLWLAWRRWAVYNWWLGLWVVTLLMAGAGPGVLCGLVSDGDWCQARGGERVSGARAEREDWRLVTQSGPGTDPASTGLSGLWGRERLYTPLTTITRAHTGDILTITTQQKLQRESGVTQCDPDHLTVFFWPILFWMIESIERISPRDQGLWGRAGPLGGLCCGLCPPPQHGPHWTQENTPGHRVSTNTLTPSHRAPGNMLTLNHWWIVRHRFVQVIVVQSQLYHCVPNNLPCFLYTMYDIFGV